MKKYQIKKIRKDGTIKTVATITSAWHTALDILYRLIDTYDKVSSARRGDRYFLDTI